MTTRRRRNYTRPIAIRLEEKAWEEVGEIAASLGRTPTTLMREWIMQRLALEHEAWAGFHSDRLPESVQATIIGTLVSDGMEQMTKTARDAFARARDELESEIISQLEARGIVTEDGLAEAAG